MSQCTWVDEGGRCSAPAEHRKLDSIGRVWAELCNDHFDIFEDAVQRFLSGAEGPGKFLASWVRASGGSEKMAKDMAR